MKTLHTIIFLLSALSIRAFGQSYPDYGLNKVHLADSDKTIVAEVNTEKQNFKAQNGLYYSWFLANGIHVTQGGYDGKLLNGAYTEYFLNHNLKRQGLYRGGLRTGVFKEWSENGHLINYTTWKRGLKNGEYRLYDTAGRLLEKGYYQQGFQNGKITLFVGMDSVRTIIYRHGRVQTSN